MQSPSSVVHSINAKQASPILYSSVQAIGSALSMQVGAYSGSSYSLRVIWHGGTHIVSVTLGSVGSGCVHPNTSSRDSAKITVADFMERN